MQEVYYSNRALHVEGVPITQIMAEWGSPCYIYSQAIFQRQWLAFKQHLPNSQQIYYVVKANANLAILARLAKWRAGFNIVSGGELARVQQAGGALKNGIFRRS